jgi:hypothetical protein
MSRCAGVYAARKGSVSAPGAGSVSPARRFAHVWRSESPRALPRPRRVDGFRWIRASAWATLAHVAFQAGSVAFAVAWRALRSR